MIVNVHICQIILCAFEHKHIQVLSFFQGLKDINCPVDHCLTELYLSITVDRYSEEMRVYKRIFLVTKLFRCVLFSEHSRERGDFHFFSLYVGFIARTEFRQQLNKLTLNCSQKLVVLSLMMRLFVASANINFDEKRILIKEVYFVEHLFDISLLHQFVGPPQLFLDDSQCNFVDPRSRVKHYSWGVYGHDGVRFLGLHFNNFHRCIPPVPNRKDQKELL